MDDSGLVDVEDLRDLHARLVACYELVEDLRHQPGMSPETSEVLAGLHYSVAKAAQDAGRLLDEMSFREPS